jgi:serine-type D-Ala-D-Ala carboxypeptidase/endopeptidase (penicillin-binding protein 4)
MKVGMKTLASFSLYLIVMTGIVHFSEVSWAESNRFDQVLRELGSSGSAPQAASPPLALSPRNQVSALSAEDLKAVQGKLNSYLREKKIHQTGAGIQVHALRSNQEVFAHRQAQQMTTASAVKLLTGAAALKVLGPDYQYQTEVWRTGTIENGVLTGNLYLKGGGDPALVTERLYLLAAEVLRSGIREVKGQIYYDDSLFSERSRAEGRRVSRSERAYNAPISALNFNYNAMTLYFRPGAKVGEPASVFVEPDSGFIKVINQSKTTARGSAYGLQATRRANNGINEVVISGGMPFGMREMRTYLNVTEPAPFATMAFQMFLREKGVSFSSSSVPTFQKIPSQATKVAELKSLPLSELVMLMNKYSNNLIAEMLAETLGEREGRDGMEVLREQASAWGVSLDGAILRSASGFSDENKMSSEQFVALLRGMHEDLEVWPEALSSLPIAGRDGTLSSRLTRAPAGGVLRAKTGTLNGVSALVGVIQTRKSNELLAFSVLLNLPGRSHPVLRSHQDDIVKILMEL